jgi:hypothetical protein
MKRTLGALGAILLGSGLLTNCSGRSIEAGQMGELNGSDASGDGSGGGVSCGAATCAAGQLCCAGADEFCSPTCMSVSQCPAYGRPCRVPDAGACTQGDCAGLAMSQLAKVCPDGSTLTANVCTRQGDGRCDWDFPACPSGGSAEAGSAEAGSIEAGSAEAGSVEASTADASPACCPANWTMYSCTYTDGRGGLACHNPALGCASSLTCGVGCDAVVTGRCGSPSLQWYTTCGYPVCGIGPDAGASDAGACPQVGSACAAQGDTCGTPSAANCGVTLVCSDHDPKGGLGGCPISSREYKSGIEYLNEAELEQLHEQTLGLKLATYKYKPEFENRDPTHLGFIIEDNPKSPAVDATRHRVDLYGYVSMVVATMQVQEREIADLRRQLEETRRSSTRCSAGKR